MKSVLTLLFIAALYALTAFSAYAQSGTATPSVQPAVRPPPGFEPVAGGADVQKVDPNPLVVGAYAAFFVGMFGYVVYLVRQQSELGKEMAELAERIKRAENK